MKSWQVGLLAAAGGAVGLAAIGWPVSWWYYIEKKIEQPKYTTLSVLKSTKRVLLFSAPLVEVRKYAPYIIAEASIEVKDGEKNPMQEAVSTGFRMVASYIFGQNSDKDTAQATQISMTSPVRLEVDPPVAMKGGDGEKIAMTAPVRTEMLGSTYKVSFVMPSKYTLESLPKPMDSRVKLTQVEGATMACINIYGQKVTDELAASKEKELIDALRDTSITVEGPISLYQYYPPFAPTFIRRSEVQLKVTGGIPQ